MFIILCVAIVPESIRRSILMELADKPLEDLSVSRPTSRIQWGIPVPNDPSHTVSTHIWSQ